MPIAGKLEIVIKITELPEVGYFSHLAVSAGN
jgi:hypothetical protein